MNILVVLPLLSLLDGSLAQIPRYLIPTSGGSSLPVLTTPQLQSLVSSSSLYGSLKRSSLSGGGSVSRYGLPSTGGSGVNPSIVAIPLYVRNAGGIQRSSTVYDILDKARYPSAASTKYQTYASYLSPKKVSSSPAIETYGSRYSEKPALLSTYSKYDSPKASSSSYDPVRYESKYDSPKTSSSSYDPVRYELKNSEPGYGDASAVSLLSTGYGSGASRGSSYGSGNSGAVSIAYPPPSRSAGSQQSQVPRLRAIEYDDNQKAALADFASALENFELKSIKNDDVYDIPAINPPSGSSSSTSYGSSGSSYTSPARLAVAKKQEAVRQAVAAAVDRGNDGYGSSTYGKSQSQSYDSQPASSYDDRSYDRQSGGYGQAASAGDYASAASSGDSYRSPVTVVDKYQPAADSERYRPVSVESERYRQAERAVDSYRPADNYRPADSYRAADSYRGADSYRAGDNYRAAAADPYRSVERNVESNRAQEESAYDNQDGYVTRQPASYGSGNSDYYESASNRQVEPSDPNCPYEDKYGSSPSAAPTSAYGSTSKLAAALSSVSVAKESASSAYDRVPSSGTEQDGYAPSDELDPSKLDLKIVHLPVSVLKRLVGSGELALPSFQKKKK